MCRKGVPLIPRDWSIFPPRISTCLLTSKKPAGNLGTFSFAQAQKNEGRRKKTRAGADKLAQAQKKCAQAQKNVLFEHKEELLKVINRFASWQVDF